ncbi:hypothetical protein LCGC14_0803460 [marine sediment metagenome]|uniref:Uncharacterized protein n=1 Tax=marine sediment metagenome TaxID=412755 RepID=A0A0F9S8Y6_9ZZZZ|nr:MAG: hypothetical protein Lokiarch_30260 [Candidatus Lokiarchaeum sp. GC14_75]
MSLLYNSEGYYCEGEPGGNWRFDMTSGEIMLTDEKLSLIKKSDISLTEIGTSVDKLREDFKIPLSKIEKAYSINNGKIHFVVVETKDNYKFTLTMADEENYGKKKSIKLSELISVAVLKNKIN